MAVTFSRPDALNLALDGVRILPEIAGNQKLADDVQNRLVLPAGKLLSNQNVLIDYLQNLALDRLTGLRSVAASALLQKYLAGDNEAKAPLLNLASGRRSDVRQTLSLTALQAVSTDPERLYSLAESWLAESESPSISPEIASRLQYTAFCLLTALAGLIPQRTLVTIAPFSKVSLPEVNAALVDLLSALGKTGMPKEVLGLLGQWAEESPPNDWVICKVLSESWVLAYPEEALLVLQKLETKTGSTRLVNHVRKALKTNGVR